MSALVSVEDEQDGEEMELCVWVVEPKITDNGGNGEHRCVSEVPVGGSNPGVRISMSSPRLPDEYTRVALSMS